MPAESTLIELCDHYQCFLIDQYGVIRDDLGIYPGALSALSYLKKRGKSIVIISNSGKSAQLNIHRLELIGVTSEHFDHVVTSGEVAAKYLNASGNAVGWAGQRCLTISDGTDTSLAERVGMVSVQLGDRADLIVFAGSETERVSLDFYKENLRSYAKSSTPAICVNPDIWKLYHNELIPASGAIAKIYEELGGTVEWIGKPYPLLYHSALALADVADHTATVCVGDSIEHDVRGANMMNLASALTLTGVSGKLTQAELISIFQTSEATPKFILPMFSL